MPDITRPFITRVCIVLLTLNYATSAAPFAPVRARHAMVVSVHALASAAGIEILHAGGNAVDAAVATGFALAVVHPQAGNIGGGGFMLLRMANGGSHFLDFREKAPAAASHDMYLDARLNVIEDASLVGYRAAGVPGSVAGLATAQKKWGKLSLARVMAPAIRLAHEGFALAYEDTHDIITDKYLSQFPESRRLFQRDGNFYEPGEVLKQPELARTLERIAQNPDDFYQGELAREIANAIQKGGGLITAADLAAYQPRERAPIHGTYRGLEIIGAPPPSSGGITLVEILNILEGFDLRSMGNRSAESIHLTAEAFRRAFFDRAEFLGDSDFSQLPVAQLIDKRYGAAWRETIDPVHATPSQELKRPEGIFNSLDRLAQSHKNGRQTFSLREPEHTTHYSIVDAAGNAVSVTTTLNDSFGSRVTLPGLGFLLNDEMDDFAVKPGSPNNYGLIQGEADSIAPGKRPLSAMAPTIVLRHDLPTENLPGMRPRGGKAAPPKAGRLFLVLGSPGGPRIISTVANILMGVVDYRLNIQEAVNASRFHHQWYPDSIRLEPGLSPDTLRLLQAKGHKFEPKEYWSDGECIAVDDKTGELLGASDARNNGKALGY